MVRARVLVAYGEEYRAYREVVAAGVRLLRPGTEVSTATPADLEAKTALLDPQVVVCGVPDRPDPGSGFMTAWVEVPAEVGRPARVRVGDGRREAAGLTLEGLLGAVDEAEEFVRAQAGRAGGPRRGPRHPGFCSPAFLEGSFSELRIQPPAWTPSQFAQEHILLSGDRATDNNICRTRIAMHALHHVSIGISWDTNINGADLNGGCAPSYRQQERIASWAALAGHRSAR